MSALSSYPGYLESRVKITIATILEDPQEQQY